MWSLLPPSLLFFYVSCCIVMPSDTDCTPYARDVSREWMLVMLPAVFCNDPLPLLCPASGNVRMLSLCSTTALDYTWESKLLGALVGGGKLFGASNNVSICSRNDYKTSRYGATPPLFPFKSYYVSPPSKSDAGTWGHSYPSPAKSCPCLNPFCWALAPPWRQDMPPDCASRPPSGT